MIRWLGNYIGSVLLNYYFLAAKLVTKTNLEILLKLLVLAII